MAVLVIYIAGCSLLLLYPKAKESSINNPAYLHENESSALANTISKPSCNPPAIYQDGRCCLDNNSNGMCDDMESKEQSKCVDECSSERCDGLYFYDCLYQQNGCLKLMPKEIIKGKCGVECLNNSDCASNSTCSNYTCVILPPQISLNAVVIPSISTSTWYSNRELISSNSTTKHNFSLFTVTNVGKSVARNVVLKSKIGDYTGSESLSIGDIYPSTSVTLPWNPSVDENILKLKDMTVITKSIPVSITYSDFQGKHYEQSFYTPFEFELYGRHYLDQYINYAQFITPSDPAVRGFLSTYANGSTETKEGIENIVSQVWNALSGYGIRYNLTSPYKTLYPSEVLANKEAQCTSASLLLSALLESAGIKTRLVLTTFNGVPHMLINYYNKEQWIPIDAAKIAQNANLDKAKSDGLVFSPEEVIDVEAEWGKGIKPPTSIDVDSSYSNYSNSTDFITIGMNSVGGCVCNMPGLVGCMAHQIQISCTYSFVNSGDVDSSKCINGTIYLSGAKIKEEQFCINVSAKQTESRILDYIQDVSQCTGSTSYWCSY